MYDKLVKALRGCVLSKPCNGCPYYDPNGPTEKCATMNIAAANAIEDLSRKTRELPKWIPITERLPDEDDEVLVVAVNVFNDDDRWVSIDWLYNGGWQQHEIVTHWMPLPEPPKEET